MTNVEHEIELAEEQLRQAMLSSDVGALDQLLSNDLVFTNHFGQFLTKQADLETHRSGALKFSTLEPSEQLLKIDGEIAIASVRMKISGIYGGLSFAADLRYTRIWRKTEGGRWHVAVGHSSTIQGEAQGVV